MRFYLFTLLIVCLQQPFFSPRFAAPKSSSTAFYHVQAGMFQCDHGKINLRSEAPLETIQAGSNQLKGIVDPAHRSFAWSVEIKTLKGFNSALQQEHFNENYMETARFPVASFTGKMIENIPFDTDGTYNVRAKGQLEIHGVSQERIIKVQLTLKKRQIILHSEFSISLEEHNIAIPRVVHQKIASDVQITVDAVLKSGS
jgi:hypothetical protein